MKLTGRRLWLFRLLAVVLGPIILFGVAELGLRVAGYGYPSTLHKNGGGSNPSPVRAGRSYGSATSTVLVDSEFFVAVGKPMEGAGYTTVSPTVLEANTR